MRNIIHSFNKINYKEGGITIVWEIQPNNREISVGMSFCRAGDEYNKETGRLMATERLTEFPITVQFEDFIQYCLEQGMLEPFTVGFIASSVTTGMNFTNFRKKIITEYIKEIFLDKQLKIL